MDEEINSKYVEDKPYSFGGKYRVYDAYAKKDVDNAMKKVMFIHVLNNQDMQNHSLQSMCIRNGSFSVRYCSFYKSRISGS